MSRGLAAILAAGTMCAAIPALADAPARRGAGVVIGLGGVGGVAAVVATSRAYVRIHHASDVVGGAAVGLALGKLAVRSGATRLGMHPHTRRLRSA